VISEEFEEFLPAYNIFKKNVATTAIVYKT
jgi:hypothetical protein